MKDAEDDIGKAVAALAADRSFSSLANTDVAILVWDREAERLLWSSPAARDLRERLAAPSGEMRLSGPLRERLRALGSGLAPRHGMRLERLRLDPVRLAPPLTCACRLIDLPSGAVVLVTAVVGSLPRSAAAPMQAPPAANEPSASPAEESPPAPPETMRPRGTVRFLWQADAETRFTQVSDALADVVGPAASDILGRTWSEVAGGAVEDPDGLVADLLARRETWSGRVVYWTVDGTDQQVPVDWAGMPVWDSDRHLVGFRGFGLMRVDAVRSRDMPAPEPAADPEETPLLADPRIEADESPNVDATPVEAQHGPGSDEAIAVGGDESEENPQPGDGPAEDQEAGWFSGLRDKVAATLASVRDVTTPETAERGETPPSRSGRGGESGLSSAERSAFREIARALGARFEAVSSPPGTAPAPVRSIAYPHAVPTQPEPSGSRILDHLPVGILVHRGERILFANQALLDLAEYDDVDQLVAEGGVVRLFRGSPTLLGSDEGVAPLALTTRGSESMAVEVQLTNTDWDGIPANLLLIRKRTEGEAAETLRHAEADLRLNEARVRELEAILDTATDGVIVLDETGRILSLNRSAEALFGYDEREVAGDAITVLLAPESHIVALEYLEGLRSRGVASLLNDGREVMGRVRQGGAIPLFMTIGHVDESPSQKFCAVLRDITAFKKAEGELIDAKHSAEEASAQKSDLLAKISHEIRTPLNAIIGFAEVMLEERFGPVGNERYKEYLKDVHASGAHVISLVNDLLDLAKIEAGRMELAFKSVSLNEVVGASVTLMQPQAARERIVMRTSFAPKLPPVVADERSVRQIVLNLVSNAIKFTDAGGQVIVSTAVTDRGEVAFRVRDTGIGMTEKELEAALEPFRQLATSRRRGGTGLGLPLTKALVEANRGALQISSNPNEGTLVEVIFPPTRVLAE